MEGLVNYPPTGPSSFPDVLTAAQQLWQIFRYEILPPLITLVKGTIHLVEVLIAGLQKVLS